MTEAVDTATTPASGTESATSQAPATEQQPAATEQGQQQAQQQEAAKPAVAPESYKFAYPEGYTVDESALGEITGVFKELGLSQEQAQKLVEYDAKRMAAASSPEAQQKAQESAIQAHNQRIEGWVNELRQDKEFGGAQFDANVETAKKAMAAFGSPELKTLLEETGVGNHPALVKAFLKIGKEISEGQLHRTTTEVPAEKSLAARMYPNYSA